MLSHQAGPEARQPSAYMDLFFDPGQKTKRVKKRFQPSILLLLCRYTFPDGRGGGVCRRCGATCAAAQMMDFMTQTPGISIITERIFESRFTHVQELERLGAEISIEGPSAIVHGVQNLSGAELMASDLRASAALVIAGMVAKGTTRINRIYHLDRGYERMDAKLKKLGGKVRRVK